MAGVLDSARMRWFIAEELGVSVENVHAIVLGGHGDTMVPLPRYSTVNGIPITELLAAATIDAINDRTRNGGAEIVKLLKTGSAYYAPGAAAVRNGGRRSSTTRRRSSRARPVSRASTALNDVFIGVPCKLGRGGIEGIVAARADGRRAAAPRQVGRRGARALQDPQGLK